jgi:hypothetical protein
MTLFSDKQNVWFWYTKKLILIVRQFCNVIMDADSLDIVDIALMIPIVSY